MEMNWTATLVAALVPMLVGFLWYNKFSFEGAWMKASGMTEEKMKSGNMALIFGLSFVLAIFLSIGVNYAAIHQLSAVGLFATQPDFLAGEGPNVDMYNQLSEMVTGRHRNFGHGLLHGALAGLFFALPILGSNALFERRSGKYILVNVGYWMVTMALMGGIVSAWV